MANNILWFVIFLEEEEYKMRKLKYWSGSSIVYYLLQIEQLLNFYLNFLNKNSKVKSCFLFINRTI